MEDFYCILEKTLTRYFSELHGRDIDVRVEDSVEQNDILIYQHLDMICKRFPSQAVQDYYSEVVNPPHPAKRLIARTYMRACLHTRGLLASKSLVISPDIFDQSMMIYPGNRKFFVFNFNTGYVDVMVKAGARGRYFANEKMFRKGNTYAFIPPVERWEDTWYREKILPGRPLERVTDKVKFQRYSRIALSYMGVVAAQTCEYVPGACYAQEIYNEVMGRVNRLRDTSALTRYELVAALASSAFARASNLSGDIPLCLSHGDFTRSNIWVDGFERVYIQDWETQRRRSAWFDPITFCLDQYRTEKIAAMRRIFSHNTFKDMIFAYDNRSDYDREAIIGIFVLEQLTNALHAIDEFAYEDRRDTLDNIVREMECLDG